MQTNSRKHIRFLHRVLPVCLALVTLLMLLNTHADAMTLEYLKKYIDDLELEQQKTQKELNKLKGELKNITRDGATLKERKEYVDRVIELMKKLETLEKRRQELLKEARIMPHAPPVLKLVAIEVPENFRDSEKMGAGLRIRRQSEINVRNGAGDGGFVDTIASLRIVQAPLEIRPSEPFEIRAEAMMRKSYPAEHWCIWSNEKEKGGFISIAISSKDINASIEGKSSLESYCHEGPVKKHEWPLTMDKVWYTKGATIKGDSISLSVRFKPIKKTISGSTQVYYYDASASGAGKLKLDIKTQYPFFTFDLPTDNRGYLLPSVDTRDTFGSRGSHGITINITMPLMGGLALRYEPVRETDPVLTSLSIPDHPSEFFEPLKEGDIKSVHTAPNVMAKKLNVAKKLLEDVGLVADPKIKESAKSEDQQLTVISQDPAPGTNLKQGNHVKLVIYGPYNPKVAVPDVAGLSVKDAKAKLEAKGLKVNLVASDPAPSDSLSFKVKEAEPKAGDKVAPGTEVTVKVYGKYSTPLVLVPGVEGLSFSDAKNRLIEAGLKVSAKAVEPAPSKDKSDRVKSQKPLVGTQVNPNSEIEIWVFGKYIPTKEEQVANTDCSGYPGSKAYWDNATGRPLCGCFDGLSWNLAKTQCVTADVQANEMCTRDYPGSIAKGRTTDGKINCDCPHGTVWNTNRTQCIKKPTGRGSSGDSNDDCPCVDEQGRRYRMALGLDCGQQGSWRDYNCPNSTGGKRQPPTDTDTGTRTGSRSDSQNQSNCYIDVAENIHKHKYFFVYLWAYETTPGRRVMVYRVVANRDERYYGGGTFFGPYRSKEDAVRKARELCPNGKIVGKGYSY